MDIDALSSARTVQTSPGRPSRFQQTGREENDLSLGDWRPGATPGKKKQAQRLDAFAKAQKEKLLELRALLVATMTAVAQDARADMSDSSPSATHNGDAGSDACDRDFALHLLSQEKNALFEIDLALQRIESGSYGICEISGEPIPRARLEAIPFARTTVERQAEIEERRKAFPGPRWISSPFSVADESEIGEQEGSSSWL
jgi:RNA polymerase-binding transcription factor DksA